MNNYFQRMKLSEKYKNSDGTTRLEEISTSNLYTHFYLKFDGTHIDLVISAERNIKMLTRDGNDISHLVPYLTRAIYESDLPYGVYACEAVHLQEVLKNPRNSWSLSRSVLGRKDYDPELTEIQLVIYDCYEQKGQDYREAPLAFRTLCLLPVFVRKDYYDALDSLALSTFIPNVYVPKCYTIDLLEYCWGVMIEQGKREGFVLFNFEKESTPFNECFTKLKPPLNVDAVVMGYHEGKKGTRLEGKVGAFEVGLYKDGKLVSIGKVPTMSDEEREKWTERMKSCWRNKNGYHDATIDDSIPLNGNPRYVIEINASEVTVNNKLRFPSYLRERTDKLPEECLFEQLA